MDVWLVEWEPCLEPFKVDISGQVFYGSEESAKHHAELENATWQAEHRVRKFDPNNPEHLAVKERCWEKFMSVANPISDYD